MINKQGSVVLWRISSSLIIFHIIVCSRISMKSIFAQYHNF